MIHNLKKKLIKEILIMKVKEILKFLFFTI